MLEKVLEQTLQTRAGEMKINFMQSKQNDVLKISFEGTDAVLCVYVDPLAEQGFKVAYMPFPESDRPKELGEKDIRFTIEKTNVSEYLTQKGEM